MGTACGPTPMGAQSKSRSSDSTATRERQSPTCRPATNNTFSSFTRTAAPVSRPTQAFSKAPARHFSATMAEKEGVHNLTSKADFDTAMATKDTLMVLDCFATWCGPCKVIAPQVVKMSDTYKDARFYKIDVDDVPEVAQEL